MLIMSLFGIPVCFIIGYLLGVRRRGGGGSEKNMLNEVIVNLTLSKAISYTPHIYSGTYKYYRLAFNNGIALEDNPSHGEKSLDLLIDGYAIKNLTRRDRRFLRRLFKQKVLEMVNARIAEKLLNS